MNTAARTQISQASRHAKITGLSVVASAILAACGGGGSDPTTNANTTVTPPIQAAQSVPMLTAVTTPTYAAGSQELDAFNTLNAQRMQCGFGAINQSTLLDLVAKNHSAYQRSMLERNIDQADLHSEDPTQPLFKGENPNIRAINQGYKPNGGAGVSEVIEQFWGSVPTPASGIPATWISTGEYDVRTLLSAPYHSMILLAEYTEVGIGRLPSNGTYTIHDPTNPVYTAAEKLAFADQVNVTTINLGSGSLGVGQLPTATGSAGVRTYPCQGVTGVMPALYGEIPSPLMNRSLAASPAGQPILVLGDYGKVLTLTSASIIEVPTGRSLPIARLSTKTNDPHPEVVMGGNQWGYVLPDVPMLPNTAYSVTVSGTNDGQSFTRNFTFSTGIDNGDYQKRGNK